MPKAPKVRKIRGTKGSERCNGEKHKVLTLHTQYAIDRFGSVVQRYTQRATVVAIQKNLARLIQLRKHVAKTQGKDSRDYELLKATVERYIGLLKTFKAQEAMHNGEPNVFDPDIDRVRYG